MAEEEERVKSCLNACTGERLSQALRREMIVKHMKTVVDMEASGLVFMLENKRTEGEGRHFRWASVKSGSIPVPLLCFSDVARMYRLLGQVPEGLQLMSATMSSYVRQRGKAVLLEPGAGLSPVDQIQVCLHDPRPRKPGPDPGFNCRSLNRAFWT